MNFFNQLFSNSSDSIDFRSFVAQSMNELQLKTSAHDGAWRLGEAAWSVDQDAGIITFTRPDGITATAPVQIIGTYSLQDSTWLWGWNHPSIVPALQAAAHTVRNWGEQHNIAALTTQKRSCTEAEAWELTAIACKLCDAQGAYRGPAGQTLVFMTFGNVTLSQSPAQQSIDPTLRQRITSLQAAQEAYQSGELAKLYLFPIELGGQEVSPNIVYVPAPVVSEKQAFDRAVLQLLEQEKVNAYTASPEYDDDSFIPSRIVVKASGEESIEIVIDLMKYFS